jgi:hypothetical protein
MGVMSVYLHCFAELRTAHLLRLHGFIGQQWMSGHKGHVWEVGVHAFDTEPAFVGEQSCQVLPARLVIVVADFLRLTFIGNCRRRQKLILFSINISGTNI